MKERLACSNRIRKLLLALLEQPDSKPFADIVKQERFPPKMPLSWVFQSEYLSEMYYDTLNKVAEELVPQHMAQSDLAQSFWKLCGEVAANNHSYRIAGRLTKRINKFAEECKRPLKLYEVAYRIDNLNLGTGTFSFGQVRFFTMDNEKLSKWGISEEDTSLSKGFLNQPVAAIQVQAADDTRAFETGLQKAVFGLDVMRIAGVRSLLSRLHDELFLWKLDGSWLARPVEGAEQSATQGWNRTFRPLMMDMGPHIRKGLVSEEESLQIIADRELPEEITRHLERAIRWISTSVIRERLDDKVVDLCTALESMLLPSYDKGRKGQMIALRQRLIGLSWVPGQVLQLYELRNKIVHGSAINVAHYLDYWYLLLICFQVLDTLVRLAKKNTRLRKLEDLINTRETKERLDDIVRLFETGAFKGKYARKVKEAAKLRRRVLYSA